MNKTVIHGVILHRYQLTFI